MDRVAQSRLGMEDQNRAKEKAASSAAAMARKSMEEVHRNPEFADTIREHDLPEDYAADLGPETSKAHAMANWGEEARERIYWLNKNQAERRIAESNPGFLLKENPSLLAIAQQANERSGMEDVENEPFNSERRRKVRGSFDVSAAMKTLGAGGEGLRAVSTATAEHRTFTDQQSEENAVKSKLKGFFD